MVVREWFAEQGPLGAGSGLRVGPGSSQTPQFIRLNGTNL